MKLRFFTQIRIEVGYPEKRSGGSGIDLEKRKKKKLIPLL